MSVASKAFNQLVAPMATIFKLPATVMVGGLGSTKFPSNKLIILGLNFLGRDGWTAHIKCKPQVVEALNANKLISVNVQSAECIMSDPQNEIVTFSNRNNVTINAQVKTCSNLPYKHMINRKKETQPLPQIIINVQID